MGAGGMRGADLPPFSTISPRAFVRILSHGDIFFVVHREYRSQGSLLGQKADHATFVQVDQMATNMDDKSMFLLTIDADSNSDPKSPDTFPAAATSSELG